MRLWFLPALILASAQAAAPLRYDMTLSIASVPVSGGPSFGKTMYFEAGNQIAYRLLPADGNEDPSTSWKYWSTSAGSRDILPSAGYDMLDIAGLTATGAAIGRNLTESPSHKEAALYWTVGAGSIVPTGFDPGFSSLNAIDPAGQAAGVTYDPSISNTQRVRWDARSPASSPENIPFPSGYDYGQIEGIAADGATLLYVSNADGGRVAVWDGSTTEITGPEPTGTFYPSNCAINAAGDVAMLVFATGGAATLFYIPAADREHWLTFTFDGPVDSSVYNLHISAAGVAAFDTAINGVNTVAIASFTHAQQVTSIGYRSFLNNRGELVFGSEGNLLYWDAAAWTGQPAVVPVSATASSGGLDMQGYNDDGNVLAIIAQGASRSLGVLTPAYSTPASVTVRPEHKQLRLRVGVRVRKRLVKTLVSGNSIQSAIRYIVHGHLPKGMRFRKTEAILSGTPKKAGKTTLRVAATYTSNGMKTQTSFTKIKIVVRPR